MRRLLLVLLATVLAAGALELLVRVLSPDPENRPESYTLMWDPDPVLGYVTRPGLRICVAGNVPIHTNSLGLRNDEFPLQKPSGEIRILGVGDSVLWGACVRTEDTVLERLQHELTRSAAKPWRVINGAVVGYNTAQEAAWLEQRGMALDPDLVIVGYCLNDFWEPGDGIGTAERFERFYRMRSVLPLNTVTCKSLLYRFINYRLTNGLFRALSRSSRSAPTARPSEPDQPRVVEPMLEHAADSPDAARMRAEVERSFARMRDLLAGRARLCVVIFPIKTQVEASQPARPEQRFITGVLDRLSIPALDLLDAFRAQPGVPLFNDLWHLSGAGHRVAADALHAFLVERGLITLR
ncbi:MAG: GDSL-type esterase/lipase family protein [Planctomycetota bacterium]